MDTSQRPQTVAIDEIDELLSAYLDDELSPEQRSEVEQRLSQDAQFRARLIELERAWEALDELPRLAPSHSFTQTTVELAVRELSRELTRAQPWWKVWGPRLLWFGVVPLLCLSAAWWVTYSLRMAPYYQLVRDLDLIQNFEMYDKIDCDIELLEMLEAQGLFGGGETHGPN